MSAVLEVEPRRVTIDLEKDGCSGCPFVCQHQTACWVNKFAQPSTPAPKTCPLRSGPLLVQQRYPDGVYLSLR